ncbi:MAG TPA: peptidylprolyl isomerase [Methanolinea sp.]|jgi:FKBP-type peptidyl-prolyl cis-trans isomerase SlyD|nr:MAG: putative FKBP-type peptidyl-prolyl cis-trans isomerase [Methanoregulaceae archaeon PtaB.Bin009]OPY41101.1 MAG: putative FKBP-type peptidyl-prolyl cis-trans isomerase [Methanoregulaceae archaeon PtaU1.Bin066]HII76173.1 peptidylprolyl isomerase [Methanolinea sp.]HNQ29163.1 peptidylprolyl isomerase [Methanolinea sp.]HNS82675.1 peptidylprolyl isomerase [Methanolinea sp.]
MAIKVGDFIRISYTGRVDGKVFDTTDEDIAKDAGIFNPEASYGPVTIRVGSHHVILGLDEALDGKEIGEEGEVDVPPEKAFGPHEPTQVEAFNKNSFKDKPKKGMSIKVPEKGEGTVVDVIGNRVLIDFNHPLAGKPLSYSFRVEDIVEGAVEQMKGLIKLYAGRDMDVSLNEGALTLHLPPGITYDRRWLLWRSRVIHEGFEHIPTIDEITLVETFARPEKAEAETPEE